MTTHYFIKPADAPIFSSFTNDFDVASPAPLTVAGRLINYTFSESGTITEIFIQHLFPTYINPGAEKSITYSFYCVPYTTTLVGNAFSTLEVKIVTNNLFTLGVGITRTDVLSTPHEVVAGDCLVVMQTNDLTLGELEAINPIGIRIRFKFVPTA